MWEAEVILSNQISELLPAEMAPFLAEAREQFEKATEGLQPHEVIQHLEAALAHAEAEAQRLGIHIGQVGPVPNLPSQVAAAVGDGESPVVVIQQMIEPD